MSNKAKININYYAGTPNKPSDQLKKSYILTNWSQEWALRVLLDEIAKELNYISGYGIWSIEVKSQELHFVVDYKNQFEPCQTYSHLRFWHTLRFELGNYSSWHGGKVYLEIPHIGFDEGNNLFAIKKYTVGSKKQIRKRGTIYTLSYDRSDSIFNSFHQKLIEGIIVPNTQKKWQLHKSASCNLSWWKLPKTQTTEYRWKKQRKRKEVEEKKRKKLEKEGIVYQDKKKKKKAQQVYIVGINHKTMSDVYKIGISNAPGKRLQALNTSNPYELDILHKFIADPAEEAETKLHKRFESTRLSGEWFKLTSAQISELSQIIRYANGKFIKEQDEISFELAKIQKFDNKESSKTITYKGVKLMAIQNFGLGFNAKDLSVEDVLWLYEHNLTHKEIYSVSVTGNISGDLLEFKTAKKLSASFRFNNWNAETMQCVDELMKRYDLNNT